MPHVAYFTPEGKARWEERYNAHSAEMNAADFPPFLRGPWGKFREYAGRLTLILTLMHHAADPTADPLIVPDVGPRRVDDAWRLIAYFKSHARRVQAVIACGPGTGEIPSGQGDRGMDSVPDASRRSRNTSSSKPDDGSRMRTWPTP